MTAMLNRFRFPARKVSSSTSSGSSSAAASSPSELESPATTVSLGLAPSSSLGKLPDPQPESETASEVAEPENVPPPQTAMAGEQRDAANAAAAPPKKARRKSYGGIRSVDFTPTRFGPLPDEVSSARCSAKPGRILSLMLPRLCRPSYLSHLPTLGRCRRPLPLPNRPSENRPTSLSSGETLLHPLSKMHLSWPSKLGSD